jgi:hypothetical protein
MTREMKSGPKRRAKISLLKINGRKNGLKSREELRNFVQSGVKTRKEMKNGMSNGERYLLRKKEKSGQISGL